MSKSSKVRRDAKRRKVRKRTPVRVSKNRVPDIDIPYESEDEAKQDIVVMGDVWDRHFGAEASKEGFIPPMIELDGNQMRGEPWVVEFRQIMVETYGDELGKRRFEACMRLIAATILEERCGLEPGALL